MILTSSTPQICVYRALCLAAQREANTALQMRAALPAQLGFSSAWERGLCPNESSFGHRQSFSCSSRSIWDVAVVFVGFCGCNSCPVSWFHSGATGLAISSLLGFGLRAESKKESTHILHVHPKSVQKGWQITLKHAPSSSG